MGHRIASPAWRGLIEEARQADLPEVARSLGFELKREGQDFRIPGHGGLTLWRDETGRWHFTHFSVGKSGDPIAFLQEYAGFSFREAVEYLTGRSLDVDARPHRAKKFSPPETEKCAQGNLEKWREKAGAFLSWACENLMAPQGEAVRAWLWEERGIDEETARRFELGFCPNEIWRKRSEWGLKEGKDHLWLPPGFVIPYRNRAGELLGFQFRLFKPDEAKKYGLPAIKGLKLRFYFLSPHKRPVFLIGKPGQPLVVVESELDAILLARLTHDCDVSIAALGSAGRRPKLDEDIEFYALFLTAPTALLSLDTDAAGQRASEWWVSTYRHITNHPVPEGKDPTDFWQAKGDKGLLDWLIKGLEQDYSENSRKSVFFLEVSRLRLETQKNPPFEAGEKGGCGHGREFTFKTNLPGN